MTVKNYCMAHLFGVGGLLLFYLLCPGMFREIGGMGWIGSFLILLLFVAVGVLTGFCFTIRNRRSRAGVFRNTIFPFGLYTVISYYGEHKGAVLALGLILAVLILLYVVEDTGKNERELEMPMDDVPLAVGVWTIVNLGLVALMGVVAYEGMFEWLQQVTK